VQKLAQKRRDDFALTLFDEARPGNIEAFALFLRPFYTTGKIHQTAFLPVTYTTSVSGSVQTSYIPIEYQLERSLISGFKKIMPIIGLGKPGEIQGVGRILADEQTWKVAASELLRDSSLIICMVSDHPGTVWELNEIIHNGYLSKTVFLMPPDRSDPSSKKFVNNTWKTMIDDWNTAAAHMKSFGIVIPGYQKNGLLFAVKPDVGCFMEKLYLASPGSLRKAILRLSSPVPSSKRWAEKTAKQAFFVRAMASIKTLVNIAQAGGRHGAIERGLENSGAHAVAKCEPEP
jgi:hypothetical protein